MTLFFKKNKVKNEQRQATKLSKSMTAIVTASLINVMAMPAYADNSNEQNALATAVGDNTYDKIVNLTAKYELQQQSYQSQRQQTLASRNFLERTVDGVVNTVRGVFSDSVEIENTTDINTLNHAKSQLLKLQQTLGEEQDTLNEELAQQAEQMKQAGFGSQDLAEHEQLVTKINERYHILNDLFTPLTQATDDSDTLSAITAINEQLKEWQPKARQTDVENLPWGMPDNKVRKPIVSESDVNKAFASKVNYSAIHQSAIGEWRNTEYKFGKMLNNLHNGNNGFHKTGGLSGRTSQGGQWAVLKSLPAEVEPADLEENEDIIIDDDIRNLAFDLEQNPAKIYKWVHDNIEFIPTYGSVQGSKYCLETRKCNATDTASLLISLFRASDIPARYVYGTIDVSAKQAKNWFGFENINAITNLLGQGGIPNTIIMNGSLAKSIQFEHVWVEAKIPIIPSRGNIDFDVLGNGTKPSDIASQWIPLDGSFKSIEITSKKAELGIDDGELLNRLSQGSTINTENNNFSGMDIGDYNQIIEELETKIDNQNMVLGTEYDSSEYFQKITIKPYNSSFLSPVLPYKVKTVVSDYQKLPDNLKSYFTIKAYANDGLASYPDLASPVANIKIPTSQLQGKPFALSFVPISESEKSRLTSLIKKDDTGNVDFSSLPTSLPINVKLKAQLNLDGKEIEPINQTYNLGEDVTFYMGYESPNLSNRLAHKVITAGEYHAIGYDLQGISDDQISRISDKYQQQLNKDTTNTSHHDSVGSILQAGVQGYFDFTDKQSKLLQGQSNIIQYPHMSFGTYSTNLNTVDRFGFAYKTVSTGTVMDINAIKYMTVDKDNDIANSLAFLKAQGYMMSANEHRIPEALFNTDDEPDNVKAISAVKALQIALEEGQKVYYFNKADENKILPKLNHDSDTMRDISNALNQGKFVTISERPVSYAGWKGSGYIIELLRSGTGAYMISGGLNGGSVQDNDGGMDITLGGMAVLGAVTATKFSVNFFGMMKCEFDKVKSMLLIALVIMAINYAMPSIRAMIKIPILLPIAVNSMRAMMASAIAMFTMTSVNASTGNPLKNCKCASGITSIYGQCWVCDKSLHPLIPRRKSIAKKAAQAFTACTRKTKRNKVKIEMSQSEYLKRGRLYGKAARARDAENRCWSPTHAEHLDEADKMRMVSQDCYLLSSNPNATFLRD